MRRGGAGGGAGAPGTRGDVTWPVACGCLGQELRAHLLVVSRIGGDGDGGS
jgi:hypothetical protein